MSDITFNFACRDDCLESMVPSDLRKLVAERDSLRQKQSLTESYRRQLFECQDALNNLRSEYHNKMAELESEIEEFQSGEGVISKDAYDGAREDLQIWKKRALEAEKLLQEEIESNARLVEVCNDLQGPTHMGEPVLPPKAQGVPEGWKAAAAGAIDFALDLDSVRRHPQVAAEHIKGLARLICTITPPADKPEGEWGSFQSRVYPWLMECFGEMIAGDREERNHRFLEEALELVQSCDCTADEAHKLVNYVYGRAVGDPPQEVGGVMVTLAALCLANEMDMQKCGEVELSRITQPAMVEKIREKQKRKPSMSPLPGIYPDRPAKPDMGGEK